MNRRFAFRGSLVVLLFVFVMSTVFSIQRSANANGGRRFKKQVIAKAESAGRQVTPKSQVQRQLSDVLLRKKGNALTPTERKIDMGILALTETAQKRVRGELPTLESNRLSDLSSKTLRINDSGEIDVNINVDSMSADRVSRLEQEGLKLKFGDANKNIVRGTVPYNSIKTLAGLNFVKGVTRPSYPKTRSGRVNNEGDKVHHFDVIRNLFFNTPTNAGAGVKVGVISDNVSDLSLSVVTGDAPSTASVLFTDTTNPDNAGDEGTALIEVIHDVAPGATIEFDGPIASFLDPNTTQGFQKGMDMVSAINQMKADGCQIIVDDITFLDEPKFQDGIIATTVRSFVTGGGIYVTSAGNDSLDHYIGGYNRVANPGTFPDIDAVDWPFLHSFSSTDPTQIADTFTLDPGDDLQITLQWSDAFGKAADNFDIFLVDMDTKAEIGESTFIQKLNPDPNDPNQTSDPEEDFEYILSSQATSRQRVGIVIAEKTLVSQASKITFNFIIFPNNFPTSGHLFNVPGNAVTGHSLVTEALVVGAADSQTPTIPEAFTSQGPATILFDANGNSQAPVTRSQLPTVTAVDGISVRIGQIFDRGQEPFFFSPFFGTSAAAPQVAGLAALIKSVKPTLTNTQITNIITGSAIDMTGNPPLTAGFDNQTGFGLVDGASAFASSTSLAPNAVLGLKEVTDQLAPALSFGTTNKNSSSTQPLTIVNNGGAALTVNSITAVTGPFTVTNLPGFPLTIQPGKSATAFNVNFNPTGGGQVTGSFTINSTDPAHGAKVVSLSGTGLGSDANDNCSVATVITTQAFSIAQDTKLATTESGAVNDPPIQCAANIVGSHSVWFKFTATQNGTASLNTFGSDYDTILAVYTGSCNAFTPVTNGCNNDSTTPGKAPQSSLTFTATAGTTYFIEVTSPNAGNGGNLVLSGLLPINTPPENELKVDDGVFDQRDNIGLKGINIPTPFFVANKLTPATYPATLNQVELEFLSGNGVAVGDKVTIFVGANPPFTGASDPNRLGISSLTFQTVDVTVPVLDQYFAVPVPNVTLSGPGDGGDFVVGYKIINQPGTFPIPDDTDDIVNNIAQGSQRASYSSLDGINFDLLDNDGLPGNVAIRALIKSGVGTLAASATNLGASAPGTPVTKAVILTNTGPNDVSISAVTQPTGAFSFPTQPQLPIVIAPGFSAAINVQFLPPSAGPFSGSFNVTSNATNTPLVVNLTGSGAQPAISVSGTSFGNATTGKPAVTTVTVMNSGSADLHISAIGTPGASTPANAGTFGLTGLPTLPATVAAGNNITFTATLTPNARGLMSSTFTITSDAPGSPATVTLSATGVSPGFLLNPSPVTFTNILQNSNPNPVTVTLQNNSPDTLVISNISDPAAPFSVTGKPTFPATVGAGTSISFSVNLNTANAGTFNSSVIITSNGTTSPNTLNLSASVGSPQLSLSATSVDFGPFKVGRISTKPLTISNLGTGTLTFTLSAPSDAHFSLSGITAGAQTTLNAGASMQISINFAPDNTVPFGGTINVTSNSSSNPNPIINLTGSGSTTNHPPSGNTSSFTATINAATNQTLTGTDPDNDPLTFAIVTPPTKGNITNLNATTGTFTYTGTSTGSDSFTFKVNDGVVDSAPQTVNINVVNFTPGDVSGDQQVTVTDLVILANIIAGNITPTPTQKLAGDTFQDGQITIQDLVTLANFLAGNIHTLPVVPGPMPPLASNLGQGSAIANSWISMSESRSWDSPRWLKSRGYADLF